jgi:hypothetical protein
VLRAFESDTTGLGVFAGLLRARLCPLQL